MTPNLFINSDSLKSGIFPNYECHVHTSFSKGENTIAEIIQHSIKLGIKKIAFTEHTESWLSTDSNWFDSYISEIKECQSLYHGQIEIIAGLEVPASDFSGGLDASEKMLNSVDFILGVAHRYPGISGRKTKDLDLIEAIDLEYRTIISLIHNPLISSIGHIGGTCSTYCGNFPVHLIKELVIEAAAQDKAVEINFKYHKKIIKDLTQICMDTGVNLTFGSNVYKLSDLGNVYKLLLTMYNKNEFL